MARFVAGGPKFGIILGFRRKDLEESVTSAIWNAIVLAVAHDIRHLDHFAFRLVSDPSLIGSGSQWAQKASV